MYVNQAREMGYDSAHLNMRLVPFEYASCHHSASSDSSTFITVVNDNDSAFDKYATFVLMLYFVFWIFSHMLVCAMLFISYCLFKLI